MSTRRDRRVSYDDFHDDEEWHDEDEDVDQEFLDQCISMLDERYGDTFTYEEKYTELYNAYWEYDDAVARLDKIQAQRKAKEEKRLARERERQESTRPVRHQSDGVLAHTPPATPSTAAASGIKVYRHASGGGGGSGTGTPDGSPSLAALKHLPTSQKGVGRSKALESQMYSPADPDVKDRINLVVIGHVDAGKSTIMGHLLHKLGNIDKRVIHKHEKESREAGKASFSFAWLLDQNEQERERGVTMDIATTYFETEHKKVTLLDAPGHRDFIPNMISGAAQADVAILVIDACTNAFEAGFIQNGQTKEHAVLARSFGVEQLIVAVNKLETLSWDQGRFDYIRHQMHAFLRSTGFKESNITYVPLSGFHGENLSTRSAPELEAWYSGPTLVQAIDTLAPIHRDLNTPFRMCITDVFTTQSLGSIAVAGKIDSGCVAVTDNLILLPAKLGVGVKSIENDGVPTKYARPGDNVELGLNGVDRQFVNIGAFLCDPEHPIPITKKIEAQLITFHIVRPLIRGDTVELFSSSFQEVARISKLCAILNKSTGEATRQNPRTIMKAQTALVEITLNRAVCLDTFRSSKTYGRFTIRKGGETLAAGIVTAVLDV